MFGFIKKITVFCIIGVILTSTVSTPIYAATSNSVELLTEKQRRTRYSSKTNPAKGQKPAQQARPAFNGYLYADFGTYNSYASENNLGGTPIYLLGTIMDIVPFKEQGNNYELALMVNDCDGYQWYMRTIVSQDNLQAFKNSFLGKATYIYGNYAGYSGVMNRPMMDAKITIDTLGNATDLSSYQNGQVINTNLNTNTATAAAAIPSNQISNQVVASNATNTTNSTSSESVSTSETKNDNQTEMVWLSATGSKYHSIDHCGNMNPDKARQVPLSEVIGKYQKCQDCW